MLPADTAPNSWRRSEPAAFKTVNMKKLFLLLILILSVFVSFSQSVDTSYAEIRYGWSPKQGDSIYFEAVVTAYYDGTVDVDETAIGDTLAVINYFARRANERASAFAKVANLAWEKDKTEEFLIQTNNLLSTLFDTSLTAVSTQWYGGAVDGTSWDIETGGNSYVGGLSIAPTGKNFRMAIGANNFALYPIGNYWVRFMGFPSGSFTDLHRVEDVNGIEFRSLDYVEGQRGLMMKRQ